MAKEQVLNVSDLAPPEPLEQATAALKALKHGEFLRMLHRREPCLLYPLLEKQGFREKTRTIQEGEVEILIWYADDTSVENFLAQKEVR